MATRPGAFLSQALPLTKRKKKNDLHRYDPAFLGLNGDNVLLNLLAASRQSDRRRARVR